jgi:Rieske Fe-S protein
VSDLSAGAPKGSHGSFPSAYDDPGTPEEISRRTFMANAVTVMSGIIGVSLAIPIVGSLLPSKSGSDGNWSPLTASELDSLQKATSTPVKMSFTLKYKDGYLPEQSADEYVWGIKVDQDKFVKARPDIFDAAGKADVDYPVVNMGFVIFSPICPHLGCRFLWDASGNKFACPCHGSQYDFDGAHIAGPAPRGLDPLPFQEKSGAAEVTWIEYKASVPQRIVVSYQA